MNLKIAKIFLATILLVNSFNVNAELENDDPLIICHSLSSQGLFPGKWRKDELGYLCVTPYKDIVSSLLYTPGLPNNIALYATGSENKVNEVKLVININDSTSAHNAHLELLKDAEILFHHLYLPSKPAQYLSSEIKNSIINGNPGNFLVRKISIQIIKDIWPTGKGYEIQVIFK